MHIDPSDTPFQSAFSDSYMESEQNSIHTESDTPFGGEGFSLSDLPPISEDIGEPDYLKSAVTEETSYSAQNESIETEPDSDSIIKSEFTVENDCFIHTPSGSKICNRVIDAISLSSRSYNALRRGKVETIVQLARLTLPELQSIRNFGKNSIEETIDKLNMFLHERIGKENEEVHLTNSENSGTSESTETIPLLSEDSFIDDTTLSVRAKNCLRRNGVHMISELLQVNEENLSSFSNLGVKTLREILDFRERIQDDLMMLQMPDESKFAREILECLDHFLEEIRIFNMQSKSLRTLLLSELHENCNAIAMEECYACWWKESHVQKALRAYITNCVKEKYMFGISAAALQECLPPSLSMEMLSEILNELTENGQLTLQHGMYYPVMVSAIEVLRELKESRYVEVLDKRMQQKTLEEIAEQYCLTRERVRQLQEKSLRILRQECQAKDFLLAEEQFRVLYETYQLTRDEFTALTGADENAYGFLQLVCKCGDKSPEMIVYDETLPRWMRSNWIRYVRNSPAAKYIYLPEENHRRIAKTRMDIENYILSRYCQDEVSFEEFVRLYNEFIHTHQIEDLILTDAEARTRENKLALSDVVLWKYGKRLRYYNIPAKDYTELLQSLCLSQYHNTEISTLKLFRDNPKLMQQYDIRDEYELHNLLRKIGAESENPSLSFDRIPGIRFEDYDREQMVKERLLELAPIRTEDFAGILSEETGFSFSQTSSWLKCINEYSRNGIFTVDSVPMSDEHMKLLKEALTEECYFFSEVKEIYQKIVPNADANLISSFNLKRMGFVVNSTYIIQHHDSAAKLFEHLLTQNDVQDISPISKRYGCIVSFSQKLAELKDGYDIIEFAPYQYIHIRKLQKMGVEKETLRKYCDAVDVFVEPDTYFTVEYLQKQGFLSELDILGFEAWFYSSLLREDARFSYTKLGGTVLFYKGRQLITEQTLLRYIMGQCDAIELDVLLETIYDTYHITLDKDHVKWNIKDTEMYFDDIMGKLYRDYDAYFEELDAIDEDDWTESEEI